MKKFAYPLQAVAALFMCGAMAWMIFVLASLDPTPPTAMDLQARNTQDLSFANMNSTAVALAKEMIVNLIPTPSGPILLPVTGKSTPTSAPSVANTLVAVANTGRTPTPFSLFSFLFQPTATKEKNIREESTRIPTILPTHTLVPSSTTNPPTQTEPPTPTSLPPTRTATDVPPTPTDTSAPSSTPVPPTATSVPPTATPVPPTATSAPPTATPVPPTPIPPTNPPSTNTPPPVIATSEPNTTTPPP